MASTKSVFMMLTSWWSVSSAVTTRGGGRVTVSAAFVNNNSNKLFNLHHNHRATSSVSSNIASKKYASTSLSKAHSPKQEWSFCSPKTSQLSGSIRKRNLMGTMRSMSTSSNEVNNDAQNIERGDVEIQEDTTTVLLSNKAAAAVPRISEMSERRGDILVSNDQSALPNINVKSLEETLDIIRAIIGYPNYDVSLVLEEDEAVQSLNGETRGIESSTDILSFPMYAPEGHGTIVDDDDDDDENLAIVTPGVLPTPPFEVADYYTLGDMIISVPYVMRACERDRKDNDEENPNKTKQDKYEPVDDEDDDEYEWVLDDRGISGAMSTEYDTETRLHMLLVHGMLHLVGYDHETDDDYEAMVTREDEVLALLKERKGEKLV
jgi:probable rRNA maturation factor